jgi:hypothetical protein
MLRSQQPERQLYKNLHFIQGHTDLHKTIKKLFYIYENTVICINYGTVVLFNEASVCIFHGSFKR